MIFYKVIVFCFFLVCIHAQTMNVNDQLYTNTWYNFKLIKPDDPRVNNRDILLGRGNNFHYDLKLCIGTCGYFKSKKFRFRISGDDSVVKLNTFTRVGIEYIGNDGSYGWLSRYGDYVKTTGYWSKASWFVIHQAEGGYKIDISNQVNSYLAFNDNDSENRRGDILGYIHPYNSEANAGIFVISPAK